MENGAFDKTGFDPAGNLVLIEVSFGSDKNFRWKAEVRNARGVLLEESRGNSCYASKALCLKIASRTMEIT